MMNYFNENMKKLRVFMTLYITASAVPSILGLYILQESSDVQNIVTNFTLTSHMLEQPIEIAHGNHSLADFNMIEVVQYYGYKIETHIVETSDGYILEVYRITGNKIDSNVERKPAVLLQHGLVCSSVDWVITGPEKGLGFIMSDAGYDVWLGNARGNKYSRKHRYLSETNRKFWDFSWHEIGTRDIPAMIDYILQETGNEKLFYIGHSQGTTVFYVMASQIPAYNDKIHAMFSLAPIAYCSKMFSPIFQFLASQLKNLQFLSNLIGLHEFKPTNEFLKKFSHLLCKNTAITQPLCLNVLFLIAGFDRDQFNSTLLPVILSHVPAGSSTKQFIHYGQLINSGYFRQFDFGFAGNLKYYGKILPPSYQIKNIRAPVSLHFSTNDWLANIMDVQELYTQLPNRIGKFLVNNKKFNHLDYIYANDAKHLVYDKIISLMSAYRD